MGSPNESLYAAIDVGSTKIVTLVARLAATGAVDVVGVGLAPSQGLVKGDVVDQEALTASIRQSIGQARAMLGADLPPVTVGITGGHLSSVNASASVPCAPGRTEFTHEDVDRVLSATHPRTHPRQRVVQVIPRAYQVDGLGGVRSPVGMSGHTLSAQAHVVIGDAAAMDSLARAVGDAGVRVRGLVIEHLASAEAVLTAEERQVGVVLVDIGGGTSEIAIYKDGAAWHTCAVPVAGNNFTHDIAIGLGIPKNVAETVKLAHCAMSIDGVSPSDFIDVETEGDGAHSISRLTLNQLLRDRAAELTRLVLVKVLGSGLVRMPPGGIVLTGRSSTLNGLAEVFADYGKCEVRIGAPEPALGLPPELEDGAFSTVVGLLLWTIRHRHAGALATGVKSAQPVGNRLMGWMKRLSADQSTKARA